MEKSNKKILIIILGVIVAILVFWGGWAIYTTVVYDKAAKEYNKAYDKARRDADRIMRDYRY